jgi:hypothetical protein
MALSANPSARSAITYITVGALMSVWAGIWYWYMWSVSPGNRDGSWWYICTGVLLSGLVLIAIGLMVGRIGREARHADAPPAPAGIAQQTAAAEAASANNQAAMQANATGQPVYMVPGVATGGVPVAGMPVTAVPTPGAVVPATQGTQQRKA